MEKRELPYRSILFVCDVNTCRSQMAEAILKRMLKDRHVDTGIEVNSGGIALHARDGALVSLDARLSLKEEGIILDEQKSSLDLKKHPEFIARADLLITMTERQKEWIGSYPEAKDKELWMLKEFSGSSGDIEDPSGKGDEIYRQGKEEIKRCLSLAVDKILGC